MSDIQIFKTLVVSGLAALGIFSITVVQCNADASLSAVEYYRGKAEACEEFVEGRR